ncbi:MAG TPA: hypothetical protein VK646_11655 [Actinomycetota bacterium]|nr:hypothetical protein [Actinomycetota bacterium]
MSDEGTPAPPGGEPSAASAEDLAAVRAEVDRLQGEVERLEDKPAKRARLRRIFAVVFVVVAVVAFSASTPGLWARRTVYNEDRYLAVVGPLAAQPAIQEALSRQLTVSLFTAIDVQQRIQTALGERAPKLEFIAGPITNALQGFVEGQVQNIMASPQFQSFWIAANKQLHSTLIATLNGSSEVVSIQGNQVVFNYLPLINDALQQLSSTLSGIIGHQITIPPITADTVPSQAISMLETALGVTLPATFGSVALFKSDSLTSIQDGVSLFNKLLLLTVVLFVISVALALVLSTNRRRTLLQLTVALIIMAVLERRFAIAEAHNVVNLAKPENQAAVQAIVNAFLSSLLLSTKRILWVLFIVLIAALLSGPYPWAVRFRAWVVQVSRAGVGAVRGAEVGPAAEWIAGHRDVLMMAGAVVGALVLLFASLSVGWFLLFLVLLVLYELAVYRIAAARHAEEPAPSG